MAKLEIAQFVEEVEKKKKLWPLLWIYGPEKMRLRELSRRVRELAEKENPSPGFGSAWNETRVEGAKTSAQDILDSVLSPTFGGGTRIIWVHEADLLSDLESLLELSAPSKPVTELDCVVVLLSNSIDQRKSFAKKFIQSETPLIYCGEIELFERERWIKHLATKLSTSLNAEALQILNSLEPWSLDRIQMEIEKLSIAALGSSPQNPNEENDTLKSEISWFKDGLKWSEHFWNKDRVQVLRGIQELSDSPEIAIPLLGLLGSQLRKLLVLEEGGSPPGAYANQLGKLRDILKLWSKSELRTLEKKLSDLDFESKQIAKIPLGHWTSLCSSF